MDKQRLIEILKRVYETPRSYLTDFDTAEEAAELERGDRNMLEIYADEILALQQEDAEKRHMEALKFLISPETEIIKSSAGIEKALRIASGLESTDKN